MDLLLNDIIVSKNIEAKICAKEESMKNYLEDCYIEPEVAVTDANKSSLRIKDESDGDTEVIRKSSRKRRGRKAYNHYAKKVNRTEEKNDKTQMPCIINIKSPDVPESSSEKDCSETENFSDEMPNTSLQVSNSETSFASNVYLVLLDIQSTLKEMQAELRETTKKVDQLQKKFPDSNPLPWAWENVKEEFNFPISTNEQLQELEKELEDNEIANKLFLDLTSRAYNSWREMVLISLKYMLSRNVAVLYNLNGVKGSKKRFRDLRICNILVGSILHKYKEADVPDVLKRISFILAGAGDWDGARIRNYKKKNA